MQNLALIQSIEAAIAERPGPVTFVWVRGHRGDQFNERADELAGIAARSVRDEGPAPVAVTRARAGRPLLGRRWTVQEREARVGRAVTWSLLAAMAVAAVGQLEVWPLTAFRLFSEVRTADQTRLELVAEHRDGTDEALLVTETNPVV